MHTKTEMSGDADHDKLAPYLLGTLAEPLREEIDNRLLSDEPLFESLRATENELVYDYALELLDEGDRARFEERYLHNRSVRQRVETAKGILQSARSMDEPAGGQPSRWLVWTSLATAASALLVIGWLLQENARLRRDVASMSAVASATADRAASKDESVRRLDAGRAPDAPKASANQQLPGPSASLAVSIVLQPGAVRSDARARRVRLSAETSALRLQLDLPRDSRPYAAYRASLRTPDDVEVWSGAISDRESGRLVASIPASALDPNDYELVLSGQAPGGTLEELASYVFSVVR